MRSLTLVFLLALSLVVRSDDSFPGDASQWHGFKRHDFEFKGRKGIIVQPQQAADQKPWIWRARFFGHKPQLALALLKRGFHLAYIDTVDLFGSPSAVGIWRETGGMPQLLRALVSGYWKSTRMSMCRRNWRGKSVKQ